MTPKASSAGAGSATVCNAESAKSSLETVLAWLDRHSHSLKMLKATAGLTPDHPRKYERERHEIVAGKLLLLDTLREEAENLPFPAVQNLVGEKPSSFLPPDVAAEVAACLGDAVETIRWYSETLDRHLLADSTIQRIGRTVGLIQQFSGSAGGQPEPREESRPVTGKIPVTPAGANPLGEDLASFRGKLSLMDTSDLEWLSEAVLEALEARGAGFRWQAVS